MITKMVSELTEQFQCISKIVGSNNTVLNLSGNVYEQYGSGMTTLVSRSSK